MKGALPALLLLGSLSVVASPAGQSARSVKDYLPPGSKLEVPPVWTHLAPGSPQQVVVFYVYSQRVHTAPSKTAVAVFQRRGTGLRKLWSVECGGIYAGFFPDTGVYDINHTGRPKIVVDCAGFTTCPNLFGIYEYRDGRIKPVPSDFTPLQTCHIVLKNLGKGGGPEVIEYHHIPTWDLPEIYHWNGSRYARADSEFPRFWSRYGADVLRKELQAVDATGKPVPLKWLVRSCVRAARVFRLARSPLSARGACLRARNRVMAGRGIYETSRQDYPKLRGEAVAKIDTVLSEIRAGSQ